MNYAELLKIIAYHDRQYYANSDSVITDKEYDKLCEQLKKIEEAQGWIHPGSPSLNVGGGHKGKIMHTRRLYSLNKVYDRTEIGSEFDINTPKIDGTNLTLYYKNMMFSHALTRGDGIYGEDVSHLVFYIEGTPRGKLLKFDVIEFAITGECVTDNEVENFRNYVSGALGLKDPEEFKTRKIRFIAHDLFIQGNIFYDARMKILSSLGFHTVMDKEFCNKYRQDGTVYRINDEKRCKELGFTSKYPRFAIALKTRELLTARTTVQQVDWEVGRTGTVNPVAIVSPVVIDDATITRVTLHNIEFIENLNLGLGDIVEIERSGGIIPKMLRVIEHSTHDTKVTEEDAAQAVGDEVYRDGPKLFVCNPDKHGTVKLLAHFIKTLGIKGLGPQSIAKMGISHPVDLYSIQNWDLLGANGEKIIAEIERSKTKPYNLVLAALGIEGVGRSMSEKIVKVLPSFDRLTEIDLQEIPSVGPKTQDKILSWLAINSDWVETLPLQLQQEFSVEEFATSKKKVCISGKLDMLKSDLAEVLISYGYEIVASVTKSNCDILIAGDMTSTKVKKAQSYGIPVLDYWVDKKNILKGAV